MSLVKGLKRGQKRDCLGGDKAYPDKRKGKGRRGRGKYLEWGEIPSMEKNT